MAGSRIFVVWLFCAVFAKSESICSSYDHCYDANNDITYVDGNVWISVNDTEQTCSECICMESKEYTVSCIELEFVNKSELAGVRKNEPPLDAERKPEDTRSNEDSMIENTEVELSEKEAFKMRCKKDTVPTFDPLTEVIVVRHKHYFFMSRIMYCCKKPQLYKDVHPECKVKFDEICNSSVVSREQPTIPCNKPFEFVID